MIALIWFVLAILASPFKSKSRLEAENAVLRHQLMVLRRKVRGRPSLRTTIAGSSSRFINGFLRSWRSRRLSSLKRSCVGIGTAFRYWRWKSRQRGGRPPIEQELRGLIRQMSIENLLWGAPRIHGELLKLGFELAQSSVAKYMVKRRGPPSQGWRTFLRNHAPDIAAMDLFVVPTIGFKLLYGFAIVRLDRRDLVWINVTTNPTAEWVARQITEAFPWDGAGSGIAIGTPSSGLRRLRKWPSALCDPCIPHGVIRFQHRRKINCGSPSQALTPYFFRFLWCRRIGMMPTDHLFPRGARQQCATANQ
jgi:hypothetical protein